MCRCDGYLFQVVLSWTGSVNKRVLNRIPRFTGKLISRRGWGGRGGGRGGGWEALIYKL